MATTTVRGKYVQYLSAPYALLYWEKKEKFLMV
jgi:hypothetical protein